MIQAVERGGVVHRIGLDIQGVPARVGVRLLARAFVLQKLKLIRGAALQFIFY